MTPTTLPKLPSRSRASSAPPPIIATASAFSRSRIRAKRCSDSARLRSIWMPISGRPIAQVSRRAGPGIEERRGPACRPAAPRPASGTAAESDQSRPRKETRLITAIAAGCSQIDRDGGGPAGVLADPLVRVVGGVGQQAHAVVAGIARPAALQVLHQPAPPGQRQHLPRARAGRRRAPWSGRPGRRRSRPGCRWPPGRAARARRRRRRFQALTPSAVAICARVISDRPGR